MEILGLDIGGSGIKGAPVNIETGQLTAERFRVPTPIPSKPESIAIAVKEIVDHFNWTGPIGCGFPTVVNNGKCMTKSNLHKSWVGVQIDQLFSEKVNLPVTVINDADAAGLAEMTFGAGQGKKGLVVTVTIGTGLGTGVFHNGVLIPNFELGRIYYKTGEIIEYFAADSARKKENLSYSEWGKRFNKFLKHTVRIISPDLFILGGGASKKMERFEDEITIDVPVIVAENKNEAGIIGAAVAAQLKGKE
ncbi:polyphosphate--glucose phosphotransferase [Cyclobacterium marinum]|uniref:ROK family protein n=1 Tax=Cyclobacterium marinum (strain ATCC 25205 / DSM 745 / LMG 13164 / NCIMB 1802) TaxID=880070 RepID=G0IYM9_CYCMS|nr:ROK family protein [Cyclobacterium marinum]AEL26452.1 ROK family protein [Cyclobacterium marinum DSM 745]MBI0399785.1 ROK family protein [Cyclobacterium marinum]MBR9774705.1 ROK family protein [Cytophagales bacterium]|tara:strand:- start:44313 stop:45059 length:747 start_codon:yes stop_codon:yes gene_type:complete